MEKLTRAFREGAVLLDRTESETILEVRGDDAADYLQRMISCDLRKVTGDPDGGSGRVGTLMTGKGKLIAPFVVHRIVRGEDRAHFWLVLERSAAAELEAALERLVILEDVTFDSPEVTLLSVQGPLADGALFGASVGGEPLPANFAERVRLDLGDGDVAWVVNRPRCPFGGWDFIVPSTRSAALRASLLERGAIECADESVIEGQRVLAGIPRFGVDGTAANLPPEAGYDDAIAYDKGCYAGQEVVARIRTYGHVNRRLCQLRFEGETVPAVGAEISTIPSEESEAKGVGAITSATLDPHAETAVALGFVRYKRAEVGECLEVAGAGRARISAVIDSSAGVETSTA